MTRLPSAAPSSLVEPGLTSKIPCRTAREAVERELPQAASVLRSGYAGQDSVMMLSIRTVPKRSNTMNDTYTACPAYSEPGTIQNHKLGSLPNHGSLRAPS